MADLPAGVGVACIGAGVAASVAALAVLVSGGALGSPLVTMLNSRTASSGERLFRSWGLGFDTFTASQGLRTTSSSSSACFITCLSLRCSLKIPSSKSCPSSRMER